METAIIIRTKNEEKWIGICLGKIFEQTYKNFEVIIVDSGSSDKTLEIASEFPVKIVKITSEKFSYPYALNIGIENSVALKYAVILSAHSLPISKTWLHDGLENFKRGKNIMGVYGFLKSLPGSSIWDKIFMDSREILRKIKNLGKFEKFYVDSAGMGVMGFTNAIILKELWSKRKFNEEYGAGGEDGEWADYWFKKGYKAVKDEKFTVKHSHNLGFYGWIKQRKYWQSLWQPKPFNKEELSFRKNNIFK